MHLLCDFAEALAASPPKEMKMNPLKKEKGNWAAYSVEEKCYYG